MKCRQIESLFSPFGASFVVIVFAKCYTAGACCFYVATFRVIKLLLILPFSGSFFNIS